MNTKRHGDTGASDRTVVAGGLLSRADLPWLIAVVALAFVLRLVWVLYAEASPTDGRFDDSVFYHLFAVALSDGHGYSNALSGLPTAQWPPGYPLFLAGLYWLFGPSVIAAKVANVVLGAATVGLVYFLAMRIFDRRAARTAALLAAVLPGQIFFASLVYSETLFAFLFVLALLLIVTTPSQGRPRWYWLAGFGLVAGAAALVREAGLGLLLIALLYWALSERNWRRSLGWTAVAVSASVALILPWTIRNAVRLDSPIPISSSSGSNFWQGHHPGADGGFDLASAAALREDVGTNEAAVSREGYRRGMRFAFRHPLAELRLTAAKLRIMYRGDAIALQLNQDYGARPFMPPVVRRLLQVIATGLYYCVLLLAAIGCVSSIRAKRSQALLPAIAIAVVTIGTVAYFAQQRYHYPLEPAMCVLAGAGVIWLLDIVGERGARSSPALVAGPHR